MVNNMSLFVIFLTFFKFGLVSFGGGYVLIPLIIQDFVKERGLFTIEEFGNLLSISQITPGPIGINAATYVGYTQVGFIGSFVATFSLILPSLILTPLAIVSINKWKDKFAVKGILKGTRMSALALIFYAIFIFLGMSVFTSNIPWKNLFEFITFQGNTIPQEFSISIVGSIICISSVILKLKTKISATYLIILSAILGGLLSLL